jgi:type VI secretion system protein
MVLQPRNGIVGYMKLFLSVISAEASLVRSSSITLDQEGATLGRREDNRLVLPDTKRYISGHHAVIEYRAPDYFITDTSANGVLINSSLTPLGKGNSAKLNDGDQIHIGDYTIAVKFIKETLQQEVNLRAGPLTDQGFDFPDDPFAELGSDPIQGMIDKNELIPADWKGDQQTSEDPFDIPNLHGFGSNSRAEDKLDTKDFDHVSAYQEAFQPFREQTAGQPTTQAPSANPTDIFSEDWYLDSKNKTTDDLPAADSSMTGDFPPVTATHRPQPAARPESVKASAASELQNELIRNFLRGAELENSHYTETLTPESFYIIGKILRASIQGTMDVLLGRAKIKNEMHLDVTMIRSRHNNPIKFSVSADEALAKLLALQDKSYLSPEEAIEEAFNDIRAHQYAVIAGMQTALLSVLKRFNPKKLEQRLQEVSPISASIPIHRQAKLWSLFEHLYQDIERESEDNFYRLFGQAFAETYAQQMQKLKKSKKDIPCD